MKKIITFIIGALTYIVVKPASWFLKGLFFISYSIGWLIYMTARVLLALGYFLMGYYRKSKDIIQNLWTR